MGKEILMLRASIIINTFNRRPFLERTLESLYYLRYPNFEVVCVNGPSTDGTDKLLEKWSDKIKIATCPKTNLSLSRNIGIKHSSGDIVCFIDDDAIPDPGWLSAIIEAYTEPDIAAVGGYIRDNTGVSYQAKHLVCNRYADAIDYHDIINTSSNTEFYTALTGTNCSFRRELLVEIGGFDESYAYFLDETDVLIRLHDNGYKIVCINDAEIYHKYAPSDIRYENKIAKTLYYPIRSKVYFAYRHALKKYGLSKTSRHVDNYIMHVSSSQNWLYQNGKISENHRRKLLDDINKGRHDGLKMAFNAEAPFLKNTSFFNAPPFFLPFPIKKSEKERLKICFISQDYLPKPNGGIGVWMGVLARELASLGNEVTVITRSENTPTIDLEENVWVHRIPTRHWPDRPYNAPENVPQIIYNWSATAYDELLRVAVMRGVDIVSAPIWDVEGIVAHCSGNFNVALSLHTSYGLSLPSKPFWRETPEYLNRHVLPVIETEKLLLREAPLIFANSHAIVADIEKCYAMELDKSRIAFVPHGIADIELPCGAGRKKEPQTVTILFVGRFEERKGIDILLQVIPKLAAARPEIRFNLVGNHDISPWWHNFLKKHAGKPWLSALYVPGFVEREELQKMYRDCDIFVAPSRYESFGLIYLEAMRWGKPCIGTKVGGIPEVITNNINGILISQDSPEELYNALERLIIDKNLRDKMGLKSREIFLRSFTCEKMANMLETEIHNFLTKSVSSKMTA